MLSTHLPGCPAKWGALGVPWEAAAGCRQLVLGAQGCSAPPGQAPFPLRLRFWGELSEDPKGTLVPLPLGVLAARAQGAGQQDGTEQGAPSSPPPGPAGRAPGLSSRRSKTPKRLRRGSRCRPLTNCASWEGAGTRGRNAGRGEGGSAPCRVLPRGPASSQTLQLVPGVLSRGATSLGVRARQGRGAEGLSSSPRLRFPPSSRVMSGKLKASRGRAGRAE